MNVAALELLVPGTLGLLLAGFGAVRCATTLRLARASRDWPTATGRVVACSTRVVLSPPYTRRVRSRRCGSFSGRLVSRR